MKPVSKDHERSLRRALRYDPETGKLFWRDDWMPKLCGGCEAGSPDKGYLRFEHRRRRFAAHIVAWFLFYGKWPKKEIDHINGDALDNRIVNLREATRGQNSLNRPKYKNNTTGYKGVYLVKSGKNKGRYRARITVAGKVIDIGDHRCPIEAAKAYDAKARDLHGSYARLNFEQEPGDDT